MLPVALAGSDVGIVLPRDTVILYGNNSHDDFGIVSFHWVRSQDSPAAGVSTQFIQYINTIYTAPKHTKVMKSYCKRGHFWK